MSEPATRHLTILLTDIKGFTDKTSHKSRAGITTMLDDHRAVVLPILEGRGGRLIKTIGDAFLVTFESPTNAVLAGVSVQDALAKRNAGRAADDRLDIRIAINAGEVNVIDNDVFGEAVNITARIEGIAEAGQVYFTEAVYLAMNKTEVPSSEIGLVQLKGIPEKIRVYKVRAEQPPILAAEPSVVRKAIMKTVLTARSSSPRRGAAALAIDLFLCTLLTSCLVGHALLFPRIVEKNVEVAAPASDSGAGGRFLTRLGFHGRKKYIVVHEKKEEPRPWGRALACFALVLSAYSFIFKLYGATPGGLALKRLEARRRGLDELLAAAPVDAAENLKA
jgi:class 3 adenylate cyclase